MLQKALQSSLCSAFVGMETLLITDVNSLGCLQPAFDWQEVLIQWAEAGWHFNIPSATTNLYSPKKITLLSSSHDRVFLPMRLVRKMDRINSFFLSFFDLCWPYSRAMRCSVSLILQTNRTQYWPLCWAGVMTGCLPSALLAYSARGFWTSAIDPQWLGNTTVCWSSLSILELWGQPTSCSWMWWRLCSSSP